MLASAPRGSVIVLADDGPYRLGGQALVVADAGSRRPTPT